MFFLNLGSKNIKLYELFITKCYHNFLELWA